MANFFDDIWNATALGKNQQQVRASQQNVSNQKLMEELKAFELSDDPDEKARMREAILQSSRFKGLRERMASFDTSGKTPGETRGPEQVLRDKVFTGADPKSPEVQQSVLRPTRYGSQDSEEQKRADLAYRYSQTANVSPDDAIRVAASQKAMEALGIDPSKPAFNPDISPKEVLFGNLKGAPQKTERTGERTLNPFTWLGDDTISPEAANDAARKTVNELVGTHGWKQEDAVAATQDEYNARQNKEGDRKYLPEGRVDVRGLFSDGVNEFKGQEEPPSPGQQGKAITQPQQPTTGDEFKAASEFLQTATETSPEDNTKKTRKEVLREGATKQHHADYAKVQSFVESSRKSGELQNYNLAQSYQENPESFNQLFSAMRNGIPDGKGGKRKMTKAEWLEALKSMGR